MSKACDSGANNMILKKIEFMRVQAAREMAIAVVVSDIIRFILTELQFPGR